MRDGAKRLTKAYSSLAAMYLSAIRQGLSRGPATMFTYLHYLRAREDEEEEKEEEEEEGEGEGEGEEFT